MNKKGFGARDYLIGLILFSGAIMLFYIAVNDIGSPSEYNNPSIIDSEFNATFNKINENAETASELWKSTSNSSGLSIIGVGEMLLSSTFSVINLIFGSFGGMKDQVYSIAGYFGLDSSVMNVLAVLFFAVMVVTIVFIIINAINRTERL